MADTDLHAKFLKRFDAISASLIPERAMCLADRRFASVAGAQWEGDGWSDMSENMIRVEVNKTAIGLKRIQDDYRANRVTVNYRSVKDTAEGTADLLDGLFRADVYRCKGSQAFDMAFMDGASGGMGAWLLANELEDEYDPDSDHQRIRIDLIPDADQRVFYDDNSRLYDKSDARDGFVLFAWGRDAFVDEYGEDKATDFDDNMVRPIYDWYRPDVVVVAWYYRVEDVTETRRTFENIATGETEAYWDSDLTEDAANDMLITGWRELPAKKRKRRRVAKYVMSGSELLEKKKYIAGSCIPVVPYYGQRTFIDNMERVQGHVRQAKDPQRIYNTMVSNLTETNARSPVEIPMFDPAQMVGLEDHWADMTLKRNPYALAHALRDENGQIVLSGPTGRITPPQLPPVTATLLQIAGNDIEQLTGGGQNADEARSNVSAEAMDIAATRLDQRDGSYMDNFRQSMQRTGEVYMEMAKDVYFEPGREVDTMDDDHNQGTETLMSQGVTGTGVFVTKNDLSKGRFMVIADVTEATATRRDKTVRGLLKIAELEGQAGDTNGAQAAIITMVENMDGEGMDDYKKWNRKRGLGLGLFTPTDEEKAEMEQQAQEKQDPDPASLALLAQAKDFAASAENKTAQAGLNTAKADAVTSEIIKNLADAGLKAQQAETTVAQTVIQGRQAAHQMQMDRAPLNLAPTPTMPQDEAA